MTLWDLIRIVAAFVVGWLVFNELAADRRGEHRDDHVKRRDTWKL